MAELLNTSFFDPIAGYIKVVKPNNYLEIQIPIGLTIDKEELLKYFDSDVEIVFERGKSGTIAGTIKDLEVFRYLLAKYYENGPSSGTFYYPGGPAIVGETGQEIIVVDDLGYAGESIASKWFDTTFAKRLNK
jgi:hypothetical protein